MCFSPEVSAGMGGVLLGIGGWTTARAWGTPRLPLAIMPVAFGVQQLAEALVWVGIGSDRAAYVSAGAAVYLAIAYGVWPAWVPVVTRAAETRRPGLHRLLGWVGGLYAVVALVGLARAGPAVLPHVRGASICYAQAEGFSPLPFDWPYPVIVVLPWLLSSDAALRRFGVAGALSALLAVGVRSVAFTSVWCFFAAALSLLVPFALPGRARERRGIVAGCSPSS